jgi:hypothetical protein
MSQQPADMEVESSAVAEEKPVVRFSINGEIYHHLHLLPRSGGPRSVS